MKSRPKIVIDARESGTSTGRYIDKLVHYLHVIKPDYQFTIVTSPGQVAYMQSIAPSFRAIAAPFKEFTFAEQLGFRSFLNELQPDLVHFGMVQQPILYSGLAVTTIHDLTTIRFTNPDKNSAVFAVKQQVYTYVVKRAARKSCAILTPSDYVKQDLIGYAAIPANKITVTHEAADVITDPAQQIDPLVGKQFIMYLGRPTPHKNLERLIAAFQIVRRDRPDLMLVLAGKLDANYNRIKTAILASLRSSIYFTDFVSEGELRWLYEQCQVYVFPSLSEGFGLPGLEAMAHGAPVVSSDATCLPEIYGPAAHYFHPLDVADIARAVREVLEDNSLRNQLITMGKKQVAQYSWQTMAEQTLSIYEKALKTT